jgi:hypothetical protein
MYHMFYNVSLLGVRVESEKSYKLVTYYLIYGKGHYVKNYPLYVNLHRSTLSPIGLEL